MFHKKTLFDSCAVNFQGKYWGKVLMVAFEKNNFIWHREMCGNQNSPNYYLCSVQSAAWKASMILLNPFPLCSFCFNQPPKTEKNPCSQPEKFLSLVTTLTLRHWQKWGREENDHQSQTNLHLSQVSWVLQFHTDPVFLHSNTRKTAKFATFQMEARLLNND